MQQNLGGGAAGAVIQVGGVHGHSLLDLLEQVFVVHDIPEVLVLAVEPVGAADGLEEAVVLHALVDVEVGAAWRVEAGQQFIHHHEQLHGGRLVLEEVLRPILVGLCLGQARTGDDLLEQFGVRVVDELLVRLGVGSRVFQRDVTRQRVVGGDDRALAFEHRLLKKLVVFARLVDAGSHEHGVAALVAQARTFLEIKDNVADDSRHSGF